MRKYPALNFIAAGCLFLAGMGCAYKEIGPVRAYVDTSKTVADPKAESSGMIDAKTRNLYEACAKTEWECAKADFGEGFYFAASLHCQSADGYYGFLQETPPQEFQNLEKGIESCLEKSRTNK